MAEQLCPVYESTLIPEVETPTPVLERVVYPGAGSELLHSKKTP